MRTYPSVVPDMQEMSTKTDRMQLKIDHLKRSSSFDASRDSQRKRQRTEERKCWVAPKDGENLRPFWMVFPMKVPLDNATYMGESVEVQTRDTVRVVQDQCVRGVPPK